MGSSTLQNILCRLGERHRPTVASPTTPTTACGWARARHGGSWPPDSLYLTILRDPVRAFPSYHSAAPAFRGLASHSQPPGATTTRPRRAIGARNPMAFDLGLEASREEGDGWWELELERLNQTLHLVLIAEHFDESLLLARGGPEPRAGPAHLGLELAGRQLYRYFQAALWCRVERYGYQRMTGELLQETRRTCLAAEAVGPEETAEELRPWQPDSVAILGYKLRPSLLGSGARCSVLLSSPTCPSTEQL
ncbi:galactose-3-O-sulfotransferase 3-like [Carettochelys insculpta]|uniref:galactose-3-O-sulfotransferase 3-like n=1 Tax=Carettochelys insculpta TaxID=44489 RepID=UPI003EBEF3E2